MIPSAHITAWRSIAPWPSDEQVEQDLVLSRILIEIFNEPAIQSALAFRGGTALHKLYFKPQGRYSEDIDLVQIHSSPIGPVLDAIRKVIDPWLGEPRRLISTGGAKLLYQFETTEFPVQQKRVKIEINTREHFAIEGLDKIEFEVDNPWHSGCAKITTFSLEELLATKLRALYQRRKGRDLYDLWLALSTQGVALDTLVRCFQEYIARSGLSISRAEFEANMLAKLQSKEFRLDINPLIRNAQEYDLDYAASLVMSAVISRLSGEPLRR